jgi:hypothetical protein
MVIKFNCSCGNTNPKHTYEYDGCLGYEAIVCTDCGKYYDYAGEHPADDWSKQFVKIPAATETNA